MYYHSPSDQLTISIYIIIYIKGVQTIIYDKKFSPICHKEFGPGTEYGLHLVLECHQRAVLIDPLCESFDEHDDVALLYLVNLTPPLLIVTVLTMANDYFKTMKGLLTCTFLCT